jgi:hypothetical protein
MGADALATTFKDYVKLTRFGQWPLELAVIDVRLSFGDDTPQFHEFLRRSLLTAREPEGHSNSSFSIRRQA